MPKAVDILTNLSNDSPTPAQATILNQEIQEITSAISSLDADIAKLQAKLADMQQSRESLNKRLNSLKTVFRPVSRVPTEILLIIFGICVEEDMKPDGARRNALQFPSLSLDTTKAPWVLSQVCKRWRSVALSSPSFWKVVDVNCECPVAPKNRRKLFVTNLVSLRIQRAHGTPLSVSLNNSSLRRKIVSMLIPTYSQWENLSIRVEYYRFHLTSPTLQNLSSLFIHFNPSSRGMQVQASLYSAFLNAPNLHTLTLSGHYAAFPSLATQLPWNQITHFTSKGLTSYRRELPVRSDFYFQILPLLVEVRDCTLEVELFRTPITPINAALTLPRLRSLVLTRRLEIGYGGRPHYLARYLILPNLQSLRFTNINVGFKSTIIRYWGRLEVLIFDGIDCRVQDFLGALKLGCLRNIHTLKILQAIPTKNPDIIPSERILRALSITNNTTHAFLPNLRHFTLGCKPGEIAWKDSLVVEMLQSRMDCNLSSNLGFARLERFTTSGFDIKDPVAYALLRDLCAKGLVYHW